MINFATLRKVVKYLLFDSILGTHQNNEKVSSKFLQRKTDTREESRLAVVKRKIFHGCHSGEEKRKGKALMPTNEVSNNTEFITEQRAALLTSPSRNKQGL